MRSANTLQVKRLWSRAITNLEKPPNRFHEPGFRRVAGGDMVSFRLPPAACLLN
jgi:hypothetical protein